jgi:hypothetical protein
MSSTSQIARVSNNDATLHCIYLGDGHCRGLGAALIGNTVVTEISYLCADSLTGTTPANLERVLQFLQEAEVIEMNGRIIHAVSKSTRIDELYLSAYTHVQHEAMANLLRHTKSITKLTFLLRENETASHSSMEDLANAVGANRTLQTLTLSFDRNPQESLVCILQKLASHPCLRSLMLDSFAYHQCIVSPLMASALACLLESSSCLQELSISCFEFGIEEVREFLRGLNKSNSLVILNLSWVKFCCHEAQVAFIEFIQALRNKNALRELRIDTYSLSSVQIIEMLKGSSLHALTICMGRGLLHDFCSEFLGGSKLARLEIVYHNWYGTDLSDMRNCLARATFLREFYIPNRLVDPRLDIWVKAVQQNGSLWHISLPLIEGAGQSPMSSKQTNRIHTYCQRNQMLHTLLPSPLNHGDDEARIELFPHLLACATSRPRMGPNSMLIALLALGDSIGHHHFGCCKCTQCSQTDEL